ncbi:unnamed protein product [Angiostrongylus costaricensis]|uniref:Amino acid transporter n=1 Tax=Angiostrongylus costaricensis TaxID=334426 RepID=A0A158PLK4_ANGCS|nr:unnamed protein product [Angiostrongylus costaricensis]
MFTFKEAISPLDTTNASQKLLSVPSRHKNSEYCRKMLRRLLREKLLTEKFLHHSELNRSLNIPFTVAIVCASSIPLLIFVLMPYSLTTLAGPSTILAVLLTFVIVLLSSAHLTELSCALPKSCVLYQFTFAMLGELPAFFAAWTAVLDSICISTILCSSWSEHMVSGFNEIGSSLSKNLCRTCWSELSLCLVIVSVLMTTSCTMVGFFHADPQNWINASFFGFGFHGVSLYEARRPLRDFICSAFSCSRTKRLNHQILTDLILEWPTLHWLYGPQHNLLFSEICWLSHCGSLESRGQLDQCLPQVFTTADSRNTCGSERDLPPCDFDARTMVDPGISLLLARLPDGKAGLLSLGDPACVTNPRCTLQSDTQEHLSATMRRQMVRRLNHQKSLKKSLFL